MHEINPVLAGTYDAPDYAPSKVNVTSGNTTAETSSAVRKTTDAGSTTDFSFGDFLDLVNPLQHIPVVSSVYRAVTGDTIHPVSRVAGDILFGGVLGAATAALSGAGMAGSGLASATASAVSGASNSVVEAQSGQDVVGSVVASVWGDTKSPTDSSSPPIQRTAATATSAPVLLADATPLPASPAAAPVKNTVLNTPPTQESPPLATAKAFPLHRDKMPFGGVMAPTTTMARQDHIDALSRTLRSQHVGGSVLSSNPVAVPSVAPQTVAATTQVATVAAPDISTKTEAKQSAPVMPPVATPTASIPPELGNDALILRALGQYSGMASNATTSQSKGAALDIIQ